MGLRSLLMVHFEKLMHSMAFLSGVVEEPQTCAKHLVFLAQETHK